MRAGAGILFLIASYAFYNVFLAGDFSLTQPVITGFLIEFIIRVINPKYAPSLIIGRLVTINQQPEYVGAKAKRYAWGIGLVLAITIFYWFFQIPSG